MRVWSKTLKCPAILVILAQIGFLIKCGPTVTKFRVISKRRELFYMAQSLKSFFLVNGWEWRKQEWRIVGMLEMLTMWGSRWRTNKHYVIDLSPFSIIPNPKSRNDGQQKQKGKMNEWEFELSFILNGMTIMRRIRNNTQSSLFLAQSSISTLKIIIYYEPAIKYQISYYY